MWTQKKFLIFKTSVLKNRKALKRFFGMISYLGKFILTGENDPIELLKLNKNGLIRHLR